MREFLTAVLTGSVFLAGGFGEALANQFPPTDGRTNLAQGKTVAFSPRPNYPLTSKGDTDAVDLTDGKTIARPDNALWFETSAVGWTYPGRVNLAVDLGAECDVEEIAIRLQGGSTTEGGLDFPGWVEAFASSDGEHYEKVAEFSRWNAGEFEKFGISQERGRSRVECLRFSGLKTRGRHVGLRLYGNAMMVSDELYVFGKQAETKPTTTLKPARNGFSATHPQIYFHKPYLEIATNMSLPVPVGMAAPPDTPKDARLTLTLDLPAGLELVGGNVGKTEVKSVKGEPANQEGWTRYVFQDVDATVGKDSEHGKDPIRLYPRASGWSDGQRGALRYEFGDGKWSSGPLSIPVKAVTVPKAPRLKRIMASMGWWSGTRLDWPDELEAFKTLGLNTLGDFSYWMPTDRSDRRWAMIEEAKKDGFFISNIDSPLHALMARHGTVPEVHDQFVDGSTSDSLCISYRGEFYREEVRRFAEQTALMRPDFSSVDIEMWHWSGPVDAKKCSRCQADFEKSGLKSWQDWQKAKGQEIITDLMTAAQEAVKQAGGKPFDSGAYDFRPGSTYQAVFEFDALYPSPLQNSQVSTYSSLEPADLAFIGDEARKDRSRLPRSDVLPWNTPGDAGTFPGEAFQWSLLENYCNGARGVWFWSSRMWDSEDLIAYNKVIRAIAPVEDLIVDGDLIGADASVVGPGRISGMKLDGRMVLLAADYLGETDGSVKLRLDLAAESTLRDLFTGQSLDVRPSGGDQTITIPLRPHRARLFEIMPR